MTCKESHVFWQIKFFLANFVSDHLVNIPAQIVLGLTIGLWGGDV